MILQWVFAVQFAIAFSAVTGNLQGAPNISTALYLQPIPYYINSPTQGTYVELIQRFSIESNRHFQIKMVGSERIEKLLTLKRDNMCSLGFSLELANTEGLVTDHLLESRSFNRIYTSILSRAEDKVFNTGQLNHKSLAVFYGNYEDALTRIPNGVKTSIVTVYNMDTLIKVVLKSRVDAGFVTSPDILMSATYQNAQDELHLVDLPNSDRRESLVCMKNEQNEELIAEFNLFIKRLESNDELKNYIDYQPDRF